MLMFVSVTEKSLPLHLSIVTGGKRESNSGSGGKFCLSGHGGNCNFRVQMSMIKLAAGRVSIDSVFIRRVDRSCSIASNSGQQNFLYRPADSDSFAKAALAFQWTQSYKRCPTEWVRGERRGPADGSGSISRVSTSLSRNRLSSVRKDDVSLLHGLEVLPQSSEQSSPLCC
jgi:hypothetical protein